MDTLRRVSEVGAESCLKCLGKVHCDVKEIYSLLYYGFSMRPGVNPSNLSASSVKQGHYRALPHRAECGLGDVSP